MLASRLEALDATMKLGSALKDLKIRLVQMIYRRTAPLVAVFVNSASMADPAFTSACTDYKPCITYPNRIKDPLIMALWSPSTHDYPVDVCIVGPCCPGCDRR